jgi:hypothetical protein
MDAIIDQRTLMEERMNSIDHTYSAYAFSSSSRTIQGRERIERDLTCLSKDGEAAFFRRLRRLADEVK